MNLSALSFLIFSFIKCEEIPAVKKKKKQVWNFSLDFHLWESHLKAEYKCSRKIREADREPSGPVARPRARPTTGALPPRTHTGVRAQGPVTMLAGARSRRIRGRLSLHCCLCVFLVFALNTRDLAHVDFKCQSRVCVRFMICH